MISRRFDPKVILVIIIGISFCLGSGYLFVTIWKGLKLANDVPFTNPPKPFNEELLVGEWTTSYSRKRSDKLVIRADRKYKQIYSENGKTVFESDWNDWWVEELTDGRMYLYLDGAKYFFNGVSGSSGYHYPCPTSDIECGEIAHKISSQSYDWIGENWVDVYGQLILNIRMDQSNKIILLHLWKSSDRGFPIIGGESELFRQED